MSQDSIPNSYSTARRYAIMTTVVMGAGFAREVTRQAAMLGYLNAFMMYTSASAIAIALILLVKRKPVGLA
jgi:hypothetical protein